LLLKAPRRFCLMNCTASSYFIPPSINAGAMSLQHNAQYTTARFFTKFNLHKT
jgi:hypothetical protein